MCSNKFKVQRVCLRGTKFWCDNVNNAKFCKVIFIKHLVRQITFWFLGNNVLSEECLEENHEDWLITRSLVIHSSTKMDLIKFYMIKYYWRCYLQIFFFCKQFAYPFWMHHMRLCRRHRRLLCFSCPNKLHFAKDACRALLYALAFITLLQVCHFVFLGGCWLCALQISYDRVEARRSESCGAEGREGLPGTACLLQNGPSQICCMFHNIYTWMQIIAF